MSENNRVCLMQKKGVGMFWSGCDWTLGGVGSGRRIMRGEGRGKTVKRKITCVCVSAHVALFVCKRWRVRKKAAGRKAKK